MMNEASSRYSFFRSSIRLVAILCTLVLIVTSCTPTQESEDAVDLVALLPLTGDLAAIGTPKRQAIELALQEVGERYPDVKIEVNYLDSQGSPTTGVTALRQALLRSDVDAAFIDLTTVVAATVPVANEEDLVVFAGSAQAGITDRGEKILRVFPGGDQEIALISEYLDVENVESVYVIHTNELYGQSVNEVLRARADEIGFEVLGSEEYSLGDSDFRQQLVKAKGSGAEKIVLLGYGIKYSTILRQAVELDLQPSRFVSNLGAVNVTVMDLAPQFTEGMVFSAPSFAYRMDRIDEFPTQQSMVESYQAAYGSEPDFRVAFVYDTIMLLAKVVADGHEASLYENLLRFENYEGVSGGIIMRPNGDAVVDMVLATYSPTSTVELWTPSRVAEPVQEEESLEPAGAN